MLEFALAGSQSLGDFTERIGAAQLAEKHGNELLPTGKALGLVFSLMFVDHVLELNPWKKPQQLAEQTTIFSHAQASSVKVFGFEHQKYNLYSVPAFIFSPYFGRV
jgi:hypothetical protein